MDRSNMFPLIVDRTISIFIKLQTNIRSKIDSSFDEQIIKKEGGVKKIREKKVCGTNDYVFEFFSSFHSLAHRSVEGNS